MNYQSYRQSVQRLCRQHGIKPNFDIAKAFFSGKTPLEAVSEEKKQDKNLS